jgi:mRNA interferase MazF
MNNYIPERGDLIWLEFSPQCGHEQAGKRPAIVISPKEYNAKVSLVIVCPITSKEKGYPFEVKVTGKIKGAILSDQVKSLDWRARNAKFIKKVNLKVFKEVQEKLLLLIE